MKTSLILTLTLISFALSAAEHNSSTAPNTEHQKRTERVKALVLKCNENQNGRITKGTADSSLIGDEIQDVKAKLATAQKIYTDALADAIITKDEAQAVHDAYKASSENIYDKRHNNIGKQLKDKKNRQDKSED